LTIAAPLENGVPVTAAGGAASEQLWRLVVPAGQPSLTLSIGGGMGNADLHVRRGGAPTTATYDCVQTINGNAGWCNFDAPAAGVYFVMLRGTAAYTDVTLTGTYPSPNDFSLHASATTGSVPAGSSLTATIFTLLRSGTPHNIVFSASGAPAGVTPSFSPSSLTSGASTTLTLATTEAVGPGTYPITVTATGAVTRKRDVRVDGASTASATRERRAGQHVGCDRFAAVLEDRRARGP
jgi:aminopeptidase S